MSESRTVHDPFLGRDVQVSDNLIDRLRGKYACGPTLANGEPEFGWRKYQTLPIQEEAASALEAKDAQIAELVGALRPFSAEAGKWKKIHDATMHPICARPDPEEDDGHDIAEFTVADLRRAAAILAKHTTKGD
jgi:hypothetical protein